MNSETKTGMGRGTLYLMVAAGVFLVSGYVIHFWLGRYLGPEKYGLFGIVLALMTIADLLLISGWPQGASKYIAEDNARLGSIVRTGTRLQVVVSLIVFALVIGLAGFIADWLGDPALTTYIRISAFVVPFYALRAIYSDGYLNGLKQFGKQAKVRIWSSIVKVAAVFALVSVGLGVKGAILGYLVAALLGFVLALRYLGRVQRSPTSFQYSKLLRFGLPATLFAATLLLIMNVDLFAVKAIAPGPASAGYYTSAATLARLPYFLFAALGLTLLPSISRATSTNNTELAASYIRESMRYMLMLLLPVMLLISATSTDLLTLVYSPRYVEAAEPLSILAFGLGFLSVFLVLAHIIMGSGRPGVVLGMAVLLVGTDIGLNILLIPRYGLEGAAWATTITGFLGMCAAAIYVLWRFGALVNARALGKILLAAGVIYAIALQVSVSPPWLPLIYIGLLALYGGTLWLIKGLGRDDLETFRRIVPLERFTGAGDPSP